MTSTLSLRLLLGALVFVRLLDASGLLAAETRMTVDLRGHRSEIRAALLQHTAINSSLQDVVRFITNHLRQTEDAYVTVVEGAAPLPGKPKRGAKFIRIYLGQYYDHPEVIFLTAPMLEQKEVSAIWILDEHDRLIDIVVDKKTGVY